MAGKFQRGIATFIASVAYVGYSPLAPGTVGTLVAFAVYWWLLPPGYWILVVAAVSAAVGIWAGGVAERVWQKKDPGRVCVDEFAAYFIAVAFLPKTAAYAVAAFILFRFFDIIKPFPAGRSQRLPGGWGIMADDVIAGVYTNLILQGIRALAHATGIWGNVFV